MRLLELKMSIKCSGHFIMVIINIMEEKCNMFFKLMVWHISSHHFFPIRSPSYRQPPDSDSSQDSYSPSTHTLSDTSTTLYTTSTEDETMSDTDTTTTASTHVSNSTSCSSNPPSTIQWIVMQCFILNQ